MTEKEDLPNLTTANHIVDKPTKFTGPQIREKYKEAFQKGMQYEHYKIRKSRKTWFIRGVILGYLPYAIHQWPYIVQWVYS
tara:strand:- start:1159 stop:1401 length:243 start_codon:yes stop_codon:yes gene_type:complete